MRVGILSDVHANTEALLAVLSDLEASPVDRIVCLGDCVGYGADPGPCLDLLFERCDVIVAGNHDRAVVGMLDAASFNALARFAVTYSADRLSRAQLQRLRDLPLESYLEDLLLVHASPFQPEQFPYLQYPEDARVAFQNRDFSIAICGHTHVPLTFHTDDPAHAVRVSLNPQVDLTQGGRYIVNVGSVGQPRDRDPRASYAIFDTASRRLSLHRVEYDVESAFAKIEAAGLPQALGRRLLVGV